MSFAIIITTLMVVLGYLLLASRKVLPTFDRDHEARRLVALYDQRAHDGAQQNERDYRLYQELKHLRESTQTTLRKQLSIWLLLLLVVVLGASTFAWYRLGGENALQWQSYETMLDKPLISSQYLGMETPNLPVQDLNTYCQLLQTRVERQDTNQLSALARCYLSYNNFPAAADVYEAMYRLQPDDDGIAMDYAEIRLMGARNRPMEREVERILISLKGNPEHTTRATLMLAAGYLQSGDTLKAKPLWQALADETPKEHPLYPVIEQTLASFDDDESSTLSADELTLSVRIDIDASRLANLPEQAALFVSVSPQDSRIPLLAQRLPIKETQNVILDERSSMNGVRLEAEQNVIVRAKLSETGDVSSATLGESEQRITLPYSNQIQLQL
ncbi:hypothetical protein L0B52_00940 [Suttonella sp. R2A3]|uniref:tetratricopeptide repeat protein n=1 Tax=Suttonella sp. R2A3 TaxID=2908648 RepID=UPI001F2F7BF6|nr:hypothetical protein [Suttonella sp. R2A3]UJF24734.1 hypothetical protein L0B52_00940 [Suttonella sp. R2A3]